MGHSLVVILWSKTGLTSLNLLTCGTAWAKQHLLSVKRKQKGSATSPCVHKLLSAVQVSDEMQFVFECCEQIGMWEYVYSSWLFFFHPWCYVGADQEIGEILV